VGDAFDTHTEGGLPMLATCFHHQANNPLSVFAPYGNISLESCVTLGTGVKADWVTWVGANGTGAERAVVGGTPVWSQLTPSALSGNVDDYAPTGYQYATVFRLDPGAADRQMTGLQGGRQGRVVVLMNVGTTNLVLKHNTTSTAANRLFTN